MQAGPTGHRAKESEDDHRLLEFLRDRDVPCPKCGYNLRNLLKPKCPECELALTLGVCAKPLRMGSLFAVVVSNSITAFLASVNIVLLLENGYGTGIDPTSRIPGALLFMFILIVSGSIAVWQCRRPQRFLALPEASASSLAVLSVLLNLIAIIFLLAALLGRNY